MNYEIKYSNLDLIPSKNINDLNLLLAEHKSKIDKFSHKWDQIKKIINDYEFIYINQNSRNNISNISPVSRSYFKLIEILYEFKLTQKINNINTFCIAEAPGGFIQCIKAFNPNSIYSISLLSNDKSVPRWNNNITKYENLKLLTGIKNNGDICDIDNIFDCVRNLKNKSFYLITGDGGFDYSDNYNKQEINSLSLIYSEILLALILQQKGGCFICKVFDIFNSKTIQLLYFLSTNYEKFYIYKPCTSRITNSEKYIICINYNGYDKFKINKLIHCFETKDLDIEIDKDFYSEIIKYNDLYVNKQINNINKGIHNIKQNNFFHSPSRGQIITAINWCKKYNIPINQSSYYLNRTLRN